MLVIRSRIIFEKLVIQIKVVLEWVGCLLASFGLRRALIAQLQVGRLLELEVLVGGFFILNDHTLLADHAFALGNLLLREKPCWIP